MYNTYISSTIGLRSKGSLCFSINDYYLSNEKYSYSSTPCSCCSFSIYGYGVPIINPRFLYGLRQSSLIHCSASRRLILGGGGCRLPVSMSDRTCYGDSYYSPKESSWKERDRGIGRKERRFACMVLGEKSEDFGMGVDGNIEAILSLLTEDIDEQIVKIERRANKSRTEFHGERSGVTELECISERKKHVDSGSSKRNSRCKCQSVTNKSTEEGNWKWSGGIESGSKRAENGELRKERFTSSSYYTEGFPVERCRKSRDVDERVKKEKNCVKSGSAERNSRFESESIAIKSREEGSLRVKNRGLRSASSFYTGRCPTETDVMECMKEDKKYVESKSLEKNSKSECGVSMTKSKEQSRRWSGESGVTTRGENGGLRKEGSSCSSYYSAVSSDDIDETHESITDIQVQHERFGVESSGDLKKQGGKYENNARRHEETSGQEITQVGWDKTFIGVDGGLRNEEEKIAEVEDTASRSQRRFNGRDNKNSASSIDIVEETRNEHRRKCLQVSRQSGTGTKTQQQTEMSEIQDRENSRASIIQKRFSEKEEKLTAAMNLVVEARERDSRINNRTLEQNESTKKLQQLSQVSVIRDSDLRRASNSQRLLDTRMQNMEVNSTSLLSSLQEAKEQHTRADQEVIEITRSRKESQNVTNISVISAHDAEISTSSEKLTETTMSNQEENSASHVDIALEARKHNRTGELLTGQVRSRKESQRSNRTSSFRGSSNERGSTSQTTLNLVNHAGEQRMGAEKVDGRNSQVMVAPPPSQLVGRDFAETVLSRIPSNHFAIQEASFKTLKSSSSALHVSPQGELDDETRSNEISTDDSNIMMNENALDSANRLEESSAMFVGEFMEKLRDGASTSEFVEEQPSLHLHQRVFEDFQSQVHSSIISSSTSGRKGPADEMWHVAGPSSQEPSKTEAPVDVKSTSENVKSRSLWSIVSDIVRIRWGTRSETRSLISKSGRRSSPNESGVSEAWFSSNEPDDNDDENVKKSSKGTPKRSGSADPPPRKSPTRSKGEACEVLVSHENLIQNEAYTSSSATTLETSSPSQGASASREETSGLREDEKRGQGTPSSVISVDSSLPLLKRRLIRSPPVEGEALESNIEVSRVGSEEMVDQQLRERPTKASGTENKDGELKQRKFERNKQVLKERFEEWEEAYIIESEQRNIDEMFMREALMEAKKAADTWEVPVGAVLVQHGKIIARGCNLVEELRDSTAHAEMICIREASNVLRTWRLTETTLYVTLEPCAMCAGAILQARIDTVVWGAPNKLLGADGSWVRLFPCGGEGESSSDLTNQPAAPVHPFHPKMTIRRGILMDECAGVMQQFFQLRRRKREKKPESPPTPPSCLPISAHPSKLLTKMHDIFHIMFCL